jgi:hypothetical protein
MISIPLGTRVYDHITNSTGTVVSRTVYLRGEPIYGVQGKKDKRGVVPSVEYYNGGRLWAVVDNAKLKAKTGRKGRLGK